jgi:predicted ribosome quality control (RQC) complex YloA/Tae2 family protein
VSVLKQIPFDNFVVRCVTEEMQALVGSRIQEIRQPDAFTIWFETYQTTVFRFLSSCHPNWFRLHLSTRRPRTMQTATGFLGALRSRLENGRIVEVNQYGDERFVTVEVSTSTGPHLLVFELMGKHSNLILVGPDQRVISAAKVIGDAKSVRPVVPGREYVIPPVMEEESPVFRPSKFLLSLGKSETEPMSPVLVPGYGAYPISVESLGYEEQKRETLSGALESSFEARIDAEALESGRTSILKRLERVQLARESALQQLRDAEQRGGKAGLWQATGDLLMAYAFQVPKAVPAVELINFEGEPVTIKLDPELDAIANGNRYYERAKKAKGALEGIAQQAVTLTHDYRAILEITHRVQQAKTVGELEKLEDEARQRRWLFAAQLPSERKDERPFEGHRIREILGPGGITVLYGENAEANDYLTLRVAKPNDYWFHVRGATSTHVVLRTNNQPQRMQKEHLEFAARIAVKNSSSKHSSYVPVDYTLKKYVRKPKSAPKGTATYTNEKTLHVDSA